MRHGLVLCPTDGDVSPVVMLADAGIQAPWWGTLDSRSRITRPELRLAAGARHERTLEAVSSRPRLGAARARCRCRRL
jgi:hypothetical protein